MTKCTQWFKKKNWVSNKVLRGALGLSYHEKNVKLVYFNILVAYKLMIGTKNDLPKEDLRVLNANNFPPLQRIIHHIITTIIFPKGKSHNEVTKTHKAIFHCLFNGEKMNLLYLMCTLIDKAHFHAKQSLLCVAPLTEVFQFVGVDPSKPCLQQTKYL